MWFVLPSYTLGLCVVLDTFGLMLALVQVVQKCGGFSTNPTKHIDIVPLPLIPHYTDRSGILV